MNKNVNDITGDKIKSKVNSDSYRDNWDKVFGNKEPAINIEIPEDSEVDLEEIWVMGSEMIRNFKGVWMNCVNEVVK